MIESRIIEYLGANLSIPVYAEEPDSAAVSEYVIVEKTGASVRDWVETSTVSVTAHGGSLFRVAELNDSVKDLMLKQFPEEADVSRCALNTDYPVNNTTKKRYGYRSVYSVVLF